MEAPKIAERIKFWQEQDRINQALIPRVLINGGRNGGRCNGGRCVPTRLLLGWRPPPCRRGRCGFSGFATHRSRLPDFAQTGRRRCATRAVRRDVAHFRNIFEVRAVVVVVASRPGQTSGGRAGDLATLVTSPKDA